MVNVLSHILDHLLKLILLLFFPSFEIGEMLSPLHKGNQVDLPALLNVLMEQMVSHLIFNLLDLPNDL
jgi:hypothetical protein